MDQPVLLEALTKHLDSIETYVNTASIIALLTFWAGLMRTEQLEIANIKVGRRYATFVIGLALLGLNLSILFGFFRLNGILSLINDANFPTAVSRLASHEWLLNPFSFCGTSFAARASSCWGFGGLIIVWWFCNTALYLVSDIHPGVPTARGLLHYVVSAIFLFVGLFSMYAVQAIGSQVLSRSVTNADGSLYVHFSESLSERSVAAFAGIGLGAIIFLVSNMAKKFLEKRNINQ